jgi:hypothetical protein
MQKEDGNSSQNMGVDQSELGMGHREANKICNPLKKATLPGLFLLFTRLANLPQGPRQSTATYQPNCSEVTYQTPVVKILNAVGPYSYTSYYLYACIQNVFWFCTRHVFSQLIIRNDTFHSFLPPGNRVEELKVIQGLHFEACSCSNFVQQESGK